MTGQQRWHGTSIRRIGSAALLHEQGIWLLALVLGQYDVPLKADALLSVTKPCHQAITKPCLTWIS
jgi:hypothetical protein